MQCGAILAPCDCPPLVPGPLTLPEPRCAPARPCPRAPPKTQPCSQPPDKRPRAQASQSQKSASAAVSAPILHQMRMGTTAAAAEHAQVDLELASNWCGRAPRALMPSPACARKGRNRVPGQLQGREGVPGGREGTPISANPPRFCPTPVSLSSPATLWTKGRRCAPRAAPCWLHLVIKVMASTWTEPRRTSAAARILGRNARASSGR